MTDATRRMHELAAALAAPGRELDDIAGVIVARMELPVSEGEREALVEVVSLALLDPTWQQLHGDRHDAAAAARTIAAGLDNPIGVTPTGTFVEEALMQAHRALTAG